MTAQGPLSFEASLTDLNFRSQLDAIERRVLGFGDNAVRSVNRVDDSFRRLGQLATGYLSFTALTTLPAQILKVRGEFEQLEIAFTTMLRSKTKADAFLKETVAYATATPFSVKEVANGAKQLLAYGFAAKDIIPTLGRLGDISAGLGLPLERLTYLYGTTKTQGRLFAQDLNQFVGSGIPLIAELAKQFGVTEDKVRKLVEEGKVGFPEVKKAIEGLTSGNGIFAGTLDAQSKSILALKERLGDAFDQMLNQIGEKNQGVAAELLNTATAVVQNYQQIINILEVAAVTYGTYKAAVLLLSVAQRAQLVLLQSVALEQALAAAAGEVLTAQQARQVVVSKLLQRAQASLNATMLANPYILVASAVAALVAAYFVFRDEVVQIKTAQELLAESGKSVSTKFREQGSEVKTLIGVIQNQNVAESERLKAYDKLNSVAPQILSGLDFQRAKTADLTKEVNLYIASLEKRIRLESAQNALKSALDQDTEAAEKFKKAQDELIKQRKNTFQLVVGVGDINGPTRAPSVAQQAQQELERAVAFKAKTATVISQIESNISGIYSGKSKEGFDTEIARIELVQSTLKDKLSPAYKQAEESLLSLKKGRDALAESEKKGAVIAAKTVDQYDAQIKALKEQQSQSASNRAEFNIYQKQIDSLETAKRRITGQLTASEKKTQREADKVGPFGSVSYYDNIAKKAQEILDKSTSGAVLAKQSQIKFDAEQKAEAIRKQYAVKSFDEELSDKKDKYELYQKFATAYGKASADAQFVDLKKSGESYLDYLNTQISALEAKQKVGTLNQTDSKNLGSLLGNRDEITGQKTGIDKFNESLKAAQREAESLADYLVKLKAKQDALAVPKTKEDFGIRQQLAEEITQTQNQLQDQLKQFLVSFAGSEQQQTAIRKQYADLRAGLDKKYNGQRTASYQAALDKINKAEEAELIAFQKRKLEETQAYKNTTKVILEEGQKRLKIQIDNQRAVVASALEIGGINSEVYREALSVLNGLEKQYSEGAIANFNTYAGLVSQFGQSLVELGGDAAKTGNALIGLAQGGALISQAFKKGATDTELYATAIQGVIGIFQAVTSAAAQRKKVESDYYTSLLAYQAQYNLLLNDQIGLQTKNRENVFVRDYVGELEDGYKKYDDAQKKYQEAIGKLSAGKAKDGIKGAYDSASALSTIGSAVATGAAIGSIIPGIGTAVGAVVGGIVGGITALFSSKKNEDVFGNLLDKYPGLLKQSANGMKEINVELAQALIDQGLVDDATKSLIQTTLDWQKQIEAAREQIKAIVGDLAGQLGANLQSALVNAFKEGTDAAQVFRQEVGKILEDLVSKILFSQAFGKLFDQLEADLTKSLDIRGGGDGNTIDDFERFTENSKDALGLYNQFLKQFQTAAKQSGFDVLQNPNATTNTGSGPNSVSTSIKGVTEETASVLAGQLNAIRITQADSNGLIRQQVLLLSNISSNSNYLPMLESIDKNIKLLSADPLRPKGGG